MSFFMAMIHLIGYLDNCLEGNFQIGLENRCRLGNNLSFIKVCLTTFWQVIPVCKLRKLMKKLLSVSVSFQKD